MDTRGRTTIVRQVWWKRVGAWLGLLFVAQGLLGLRSEYTSAWFAGLLLASGLLFLVVGWRQGVEVTDRGVVGRRLAPRRKRTASWADIERFDRTRSPVAVLRDGTTVTLFDWTGDGEAVLAQLEAERRARGAPSGPDDADG